MKQCKRAFCALLCILFFSLNAAGSINAAAGQAERSAASGNAASPAGESRQSASEGKAAVPAKAKDISFGHELYSAVLYQPRKIPLSVTPQDGQTGKVTWHVGNSSVAKVDQSGVVTMKAMGQTALFAVTEDGKSAVCVVRAELPDEWFIEDVPVICQWDDFPSGCECISTTMLLQYYGYDISPYDFIDDHVPTGFLREESGGTLYGPDTSSVFIGSPYSTESLGCFPPVMAHAAGQVLKPGNEAAVTTGTTLDSMIRNYIVYNKPVLIWATMYMWEPFITYEWTVEDAADYSPYEDGDTCAWIANEHCLVLTGYDADYYYFNDPNYNYSVRYERGILEQRFEEVGRSSMAIKGDVQK